MLKGTRYCSVCGTYFRGSHPVRSKYFNKKQVRELRKLHLCGRCYMSIFKETTSIGNKQITPEKRLELIKQKAQERLKPHKKVE